MHHCQLEGFFFSVADCVIFCSHEYQYPPGTPEISSAFTENLTTGGQGAATTGAQVGYKRHAFIGSCKHHIWQAIRASSAAPYYLDDFSDGNFSYGPEFLFTITEVIRKSCSFSEHHTNRCLSLARWCHSG